MKDDDDEQAELDELGAAVHSEILKIIADFLTEEARHVEAGYGDGFRVVIGAAILAAMRHVAIFKSPEQQIRTEIIKIVDTLIEEFGVELERVSTASEYVRGKSKLQ